MIKATLMFLDGREATADIPEHDEPPPSLKVPLGMRPGAEAPDIAEFSLSRPLPSGRWLYKQNSESGLILP